VRSLQPDCWGDLWAPTLAAHTRTSGPNRSQEATGRKNRGLSHAMSISYLPATFMTLFFLAASLLLGLMS
jgi:hypothetical protein